MKDSPFPFSSIVSLSIWPGKPAALNYASLTRICLISVGKSTALGRREKKLKKEKEGVEEMD